MQSRLVIAVCVLCFPFIVCKEAKSNEITSTVTVVDAPEKWDCEEFNFCNDLKGFESIRWLHRQLDDDQNGKVDMAESADFFKHDLNHSDANERQKRFHGNDMQISVDELWRHWLKSEVHNWTVDQTVEWLLDCVKLAQYEKRFRDQKVNGSTLPRLASSQSTYMWKVLGIKDPIHRQKLALKAMDAVLFGASGNGSTYAKDLALAMSLLVAMCGCCFAVWQRKHNQAHLKKMLSDMEALQKAEEQLQKLQKELHIAQAESKADKPMRDDSIIEQNCMTSSSSGQTLLIYQLQAELKEAKAHVQRLENALSKNQWTPPANLQHWLQLTHELELNSHSSKRLAADLQLLAAKEACEKLKRKRASLLGSFRVAHGSSIDDVDNRILQAKESLAEITRELQERLTRWKQIEKLCGFSIQQNRGQLYLQKQLNQSLSNTTGTVHLARTPSDATITETDSLDFPTGQNGSVHLISDAQRLLAHALAQKTVMLNGGKIESFVEEESSGSETSDKRRRGNSVKKQLRTGDSLGSQEDSCSLDSQFADHTSQQELLNQTVHSHASSLDQTDFNRCDKKRKGYRIFSVLRKRGTKVSLEGS